MTEHSIVQLNRRFKRSELSWSNFLPASATDLGWENLSTIDLVIVLGEAGAGKSTEMKNRVKVLRAANQYAFFIPINEIAGREAWELTVVADDLYHTWLGTSEPATFFFDSIDEARLKNATGFVTALRVIRNELKDYFSRIKIVVSSRPSDWNIAEVKAAVNSNLAAPLSTAKKVAQEDAPLSHDVGTSAQLLPQIEVPAPAVFWLTSLSGGDRELLAKGFGLKGEDDFWRLVIESEFLEFASRPRDLKWMVLAWNNTGKLGTYAELIENGVASLLTEENQIYTAAEAALSPNRLRDGAEWVAAAAVFTSNHTISISDMPHADELVPLSILDTWPPHEVKKLLDSAIFDMVGYGRMGFSNRFAREYLAASWVNRRLRNNVPIGQVRSLFMAEQYGQRIVPSSRRATLCWLCVLNSSFSTWVGEFFPELFVFEGDQEGWNARAAQDAFSNYIAKVSAGHKNDWYNTAAETKRIIARLPDGLVKHLIEQYFDNDRACWTLLEFVGVGKIIDCRDVAFRTYKTAPLDSYRIHSSIRVIGAIGTVSQKESVRKALVDGKFTLNEVIGTALTSLGITGLRAPQVAGILRQIKAQQKSSADVSYPLALLVKEIEQVETAEVLLEAVISLLPPFHDANPLANDADFTATDSSWLYSVVAESFKRVLELRESSSSEIPKSYMMAAAHILHLERTIYADGNRFDAIRKIINGDFQLKWALADEIARADCASNISRLDHGQSIVALDFQDLPEIAARSIAPHLAPEARDQWFNMGARIIFSGSKGRRRHEAFQMLCVGPTADLRAEQIRLQAQARVGHQLAARALKRDYRNNKGSLKQEKLHAIDLVNADLEKIRTATKESSLIYLVRFAYSHSSAHYFDAVDFDVIESHFSTEIAGALLDGLVRFFNLFEVPNPADWEAGKIPWSVVLATAGVHAILERGTWSGGDIPYGKLVRLDLWGPNVPSQWMQSLVVGHEQDAVTSLLPWVSEELSFDGRRNAAHSPMQYVLNAPKALQTKFLAELGATHQSGDLLSLESRKGLIDAMAECDIISVDEFADISHRMTATALESDGLLHTFDWFSRWRSAAPTESWEWFKTHLKSLGKNGKATQLQFFAKNIGSLAPSRNFDGTERIKILVEIRNLLYPLAQLDVDLDWQSEDDITRLVHGIPNLLVNTPGEAANRALRELAAGEPNPYMSAWLNERSLEHATFAVNSRPVIEIDDLKSISRCFEPIPKLESDLFTLVLARLEDIRENFESGPFSERYLFSDDTPEEHIQNWLAARLEEVPQLRRFTVHREEEVGRKKKTDIQVASEAFKVCIEVKPLGTDRYTFNELVDTLKRQMFKQYLSGPNSSHGILLLFCLKDRQWKIHDRMERLDGLIANLQAEADLIVEKSNSRLHALRIFGLRCF